MHVNAFSRVGLTSRRPHLASLKIAVLTVGIAAATLSPVQVNAQSLNVFGNTASGNNSGPLFNTTVASGSVTGSSSVTSVDSEGGSGVANVQGTADFGNLHTYAHASFAYPGPEAQHGSSANVGANFHDTLTVTSTLIPTGTLCELMFETSLDGTLTATGAASLAQVSASLNVINPNFGNAQQQQSISKSAGAAPYDYSDPNILMTARVGDTITLSGFLYSFAASGAFDDISNPVAISNYSDTANFYADSLTPGVSFTSASGHDYSAPAAVPEASTCLSFGGLLLGLGGMAVRMRRRRRVSCE